jgi:hypothetical protein|tara:strand:+ start:365 stop:511 length:147 start_codon:yes stop_codon:yes gene_type:complete
VGGFLVEGAGNVNDGGFLDGGPGYVMGGLNDLLGGFLLPKRKIFCICK